MRRRSYLRAALAAACLGLTVAVPAASAPAVPPDVLSGTWQVTRVCESGCTGTTIAREVVSPYRSGVFMATGTTPFVLYRFGKRSVVAHSALSSAVLTIRVPGRLMRGPGVLQDGSTIATTWQCLAPAGSVATSTATPSTLAASRITDRVQVKAQRIC